MESRTQTSKIMSEKREYKFYPFQNRVTKHVAVWQAHLVFVYDLGFPTDSTTKSCHSGYVVDVSVGPGHVIS